MGVDVWEPEPSRWHARDRLEVRRVTPPPSPLVVRPRDVMQGDLAGCPVVAALAAIAHSRPARISHMLGRPTVAEVWAHRTGDIIRWTDAYYDVRFPGRAGTVRITDLAYHRNGRPLYASTPSGGGWPSLIEKAYAAWKGRGRGGSYSNLDKRVSSQPPGGGDVICDFVGRHDMADITGQRFYTGVDCRTREADDRALSAIADLGAMASRARRRPTIAASRPGSRRHGIVDDHAYAVLGGNRRRIRLLNPWGGPGAIRVMAMEEFAHEFTAVWQAR